MHLFTRVYSIKLIYFESNCFVRTHVWLIHHIHQIFAIYVYVLCAWEPSTIVNVFLYASLQFILYLIDNGGAYSLLLKFK